MEFLGNEIAARFGQGNPPHPDDVVQWDGFNQLDKENALKFYPGKTWPDVLQYLRGLKNNSGFGGTYNLEEWSVLGPDALPYYLRAFLEFLLETLSSPETNEEFVSFFLEELYQVVYMNKGSPFSPEQTLILQRVAQFIGEHTKDDKYFPYFNQDIKDQVDKFLAEIKKQNLCSP